MKLNRFSLVLLLVSLLGLDNLHAQFKITPDQVGLNVTTIAPSAVLEIQSTEKGLLIPQMTSTQRSDILTPADGLVVYDETTQSFWYYAATNIWTEIPAGPWAELSDDDLDTKIYVEKTPDEDIIRFDLAGTERWNMSGHTLGQVNAGRSVFIGEDAGLSDDFNIKNNVGIGNAALEENTTGQDNVAVGREGLKRNASGVNNVALGARALLNNVDGFSNVAIGGSALLSNLSGYRNTAVGRFAIGGNKSGYENTGIGRSAMTVNQTGTANTAIGYNPIFNSNIGDYNTAQGYFVLFESDTAYYNTAVGYLTLYLKTLGDYNTALGDLTLTDGTSMEHNTALGRLALNSTDGNYNTALGYNASVSDSIGEYNTAIGYVAAQMNTTGTDNVAVGREALLDNTAGSDRTALGRSANSTGILFLNNTGLGRNADCTLGNQVRIGNLSVSSNGGYAAWSNLSDARFKENIQENVEGLSFINQLHPVTYTIDPKGIEDFFEKNYGERDTTEWATKYDASKLVRTGFLAQEVEEAAQSLAFDFSGVDAPKNEASFYALRYATFSVPLVKAVQELSVTDTERSARIMELKRENEALQKEVDDLYARAEKFKSSFFHSDSQD